MGRRKLRVEPEGSFLSCSIEYFLTFEEIEKHEMHAKGSEIEPLDPTAQ